MKALKKKTSVEDVMLLITNSTTNAIYTIFSILNGNLINPPVEIIAVRYQQCIRVAPFYDFKLDSNKKSINASISILFMFWDYK